MKNIFRILCIALLVPLLLTSCKDEDYNDWTSQEPSFKLFDTTLGANVLYESMENNPFVLTWDDSVVKNGTYSVMVSSNENFEKKVILGTSEVNTYRTTIGELNTAMLQAGLTPYSSKKAYIRIENGTQFSNTISFDVTTYPASSPVITNPKNGSVIPLNSANTTELITISWDDYADYGVPVKYTVDYAKKGGTFKNLGVVNSTSSDPKKSLQMQSKDFVFALLNAGGTANMESEFDLKVTAETTSTGGTIIKSSDVVTFKAKPYEVTSYLYAPGAYQGWSPETAESLISPKSDGIYTGYIKYLEPNSEFKITPARNWDNSYGTDDNVHIIYNGGGNLKAANSGYQKLTVDTNALTFSLEAYSWGLVGSSTPGGWDNDTDMVWNSANQTWEIANVALSAGDIKFRLNDGWDVNYGDNGADGSLESGGANIAITTAGNYKIVLDLVNMVYTVTKL